MELIQTRTPRRRQGHEVLYLWFSAGPTALILALVLATVGCKETSPLPHSPHLIVVLVDALRADHLPRWGYERLRTPNLDRFFSEAAVFEKTRSQASCTFPSVNSLLTSRYPFEFISRGLTSGRDSTPMGVEDVEILWQSPNRPAHFGIPDDLKSLPRILADAGYTTAAVSASPIVRNLPDTKATNQWGGYGGGFFTFHETCLNQRAECVNHAVLEIVEKLSAEKPLFLYLHYMEPHAPYEAPKWARGRLSGAYQPTLDFIREGNPYPIAQMLRQQPDQPPDVAAEDIDHLTNLYDEEIEYFDSQFGSLLSLLKLRGVLENAVVVFVSDHGEAFLDHGFMAHCYTTFDSEVRVPLAFWLGADHGLRGGVRIDEPVGLIDVAPTLVELAGVEPGQFGFSGRSLLPLLESAHGWGTRGRQASEPVFSAQRSYRSVTDGRWKLVRDLQTGSSALFDLKEDPAELEDLKDVVPQQHARLAAHLHEFLLATEGRSYADESVGAGKAIEDRLRALGYME